MGIITYQNIEVEPFKIKRVTNLHVVKKINEHTILFLEGILNDEVNDVYVNDELDKKTIKIKVKTKEDEKIIFSGIVKNIEVKTRLDMYYLTIEAVSHSKKIDIEWIRRSYQKLDMNYDELMKKAVEKTSGADVMYKIEKNKSIDNFILQYDETPWEFVKRMASRLGAPLVVEDILDEPKVYAGVPNKSNVGKIEDFVYTIRKETHKYRDTVENYKEQGFESDYISYEVVSEKIFEIGNTVTHKDIMFYIKEVNLKLVDGIFKNIYKLVGKGGFHQNIIKNSKIIGLSLEGDVLARAADNVKIFLDIDKPHPPEDFCWFKYSTPYTSDNGGGFYCMPENGEKVRLYMPDWDDEHAYSTSCVRLSFETSEERGVPDIKYWRTLAGKEIMFTPEGIKIRCLDNEIFINLIVEEGVLVQSNKPIYVIANEGADISLYAEGKIVMAAEKEFDAFCNGSRINMKDGITKIRGDYIKEN